MNYLFVIGGVVLIIVLYFIYVLLTDNSLSSGIQDLSTPVSTPAKKLKSSGSTIFSYQFWVFMTRPTTQPLPIVSRTSGSNTRFNIDLSGTQLVIRNGTTDLMVATNQFPIQKWTCVLVNYSASSNILECYINGKLVYTKQVDVVPTNMVIASDQLTVGSSSIQGYITKVIYLPETINSDDAWKNYLQGNGQLSISSYFAGYNLNMAISKDDIVQRNWRLFS